MQHVIFLGSEAFIGIPQTVAIERTYLGRAPACYRPFAKTWMAKNRFNFIITE